MDTNSIYVVDDDQAVLMSVQAMLSQHGYHCQCYLTAGEFLRHAAADRPGCVITDLQMPEISGVELQQRLVADQSPLSVVVVTGVADVPTTVSLMERGAVTLLEKPYNHDDLVRAVERGLALSRERWLQRQNQSSVLERLASLSDDERRVMDCMLTGQPNKAVAHRLELSMRTVDRRRQAVLEKMGVRTAPELALLLGAAGISAPPATDSAVDDSQSAATQ
ncbi:MAG: response regulator transcription factor [Pirellulales bacterium]